MTQFFQSARREAKDIHIDIEKDSDELVLNLEIIDGILFDGNAPEALHPCLRLGMMTRLSSFWAARTSMLSECVLYIICPLCS